MQLQIHFDFECTIRTKYPLQSNNGKFSPILVLDNGYLKGFFLFKESNNQDKTSLPVLYNGK